VKQVPIEEFIAKLRDRFQEEQSGFFDWHALGEETGGLWRRVPRCTLLYVNVLCLLAHIFFFFNG
jgi:hypothetical protein